MAQAQGVETLSSVDELETIVETDGHVQESFDFILPHVDDQYEYFRDFVKRSPSAGTEMYPNTIPSPTYQYEHMKKEKGMEARFLSDPQDASAVAEMADDIDIDLVIVNPTMNLGFSVTRNHRLAGGMMNGYNNWLVDDLDNYDNVYGNILISRHDPQEAVEEIERLASEEKMVGIQLVGTGITPPPGHPMYDPIWEAAADHDLPVSMHTGTGYKAFPEQFFWSETYAEDHLYQHPFAHMWNMTSLIFGGVPERYPNVKFVLQEAGIGYVPYMLQRMDDSYRQFGHDVPEINELPSTYARENFYWGSQPLGHTARNPQHIAWMIDMIGADRVMFASDIPHPDFDLPDEMFNRIRAHFDADEVRGIMGETAIELFGLA